MSNHKELESFFDKFPLKQKDIIDFSKKLGFGELEPDTLIETLKACGMPIEPDGESYFLSTSKTSLAEATFCFVDIETNGSNPLNSQVIEIGAVKYKNGEAIAFFEELVYADRLPQNIAEITELTLEQLKYAKPEKEALRRFKEFLGDSIFCAHSADFDFSFLSRSFQKYSLGPLLNRKICTLDLAKKTLKASKYGLKALKEELGLGDDIHHRALPDAKSSAFIFEAGIKNIEDFPQTVECLIKFIKQKPQEKELSPTS